MYISVKVQDAPIIKIDLTAIQITKFEPTRCGRYVLGRGQGEMAVAQ